MEPQSRVKARQSKKGDRHLCISLEPEIYAIPLLDVHEIQAFKAPTPVPNMPPHVRGVVNLYGSIVPLVDLRLRLGLPTVAYGKTTVVVFVTVGSVTVGLIVDGATRVFDLGAEEIAAAPEMGGRGDASFVKGLARQESGLIIVLDTRRLLAADPALPAMDVAAPAAA